MTVDRHTQRLLHQQLAVARFDKLKELIAPVRRAIRACEKGELDQLFGDAEALEALRNANLGSVLFAQPAEGEPDIDEGLLATQALLDALTGRERAA